MENDEKPPTFFDVLCYMASIHRRAIIVLAIMAVPAWLGGGFMLTIASWIAHAVWAPVPSLGYWEAVAGVIALWLLHWAVKWIKYVTPPGGRAGRIVYVPRPTDTEYTGWNRAMRVTLTATDNPYLQPRLPLTGLARVHEMRTDDYAQPRGVSFQETTAGGALLGPPVMVDGAHFTYEPPSRTP